MLTLGDICEISATERARWLDAYERGLLDSECAERLMEYVDHWRGLAVEWAIFVDSLPTPRDLLDVMVSA